MIDLVGGHQDKFTQQGGELIKAVCPTEAKFYATHGKKLTGIIPRYRLLGEMREGAKIAFAPVGENLQTPIDSQDYPQPPTSGDINQKLGSLKYLDIKVGRSFCAYEAVLQHPQKWGNLSETELAMKLEKRQEKECRYGVHDRGFRVVNYTGAPQAENASKTRMMLANQEATRSLKNFFCDDALAMKRAIKVLAHMRSTLGNIDKVGALGFIGASVLFAYNPKLPGQVEVKLIDFAHVLFADIYSNADHCQQTAAVRTAFLVGVEKLASALANSASGLQHAA